jgi:hypothetical protein
LPAGICATEGGLDTALAANANMFLDDFLLFDVTKPITDTSPSRSRKSTLSGKTYETGGGTVNADVIDALLPWLVNRDREPCTAERPGPQAWYEEFPIFATPNTELQTYRPHRPRRGSGQGLGIHRGLRRELAPLIANIKLIGVESDNCASSKRSTAKIIERLMRSTIPPGLSLHEHLRHSSVGLSQGSRSNRTVPEVRRMGCAISSEGSR